MKTYAQVVLALIQNSLREALRDRLYIAIIFISFVLILLSLILGEMSFAEQERILINFSLAAIHLTAMGMAIFSGSYAVNREIEKYTYSTILVRPVSRGQFLIGKYVGLFGVLIGTIFSLCMVLALLVGKVSLIAVLLKIGFGISLEVLTISALSFFLATFLRPVVALFASFGLFILGHWLPDLKYFAEHSDSPAFMIFAEVLNWCTPHLYQMNWRQHVFVQEGVAWSQISLASIHALAWSVLTLYVTLIIFRRKDLV